MEPKKPEPEKKRAVDAPARDDVHEQREAEQPREGTVADEASDAAGT